MASISAKELSAISDLLTMEKNVTEKYRAYACETSDTLLTDRFEQLAARHQRHFDELYTNLK